MTCRFRHKFEARYNYGPVTFEDDPFGYPTDSLVKSNFKMALEKTYIHDICIKCGKIVKDELK